jgi:hypothetical protein
MTYHTNNIEDFALPLPITQAARHTAEQFATQQPTPQKAEQVRLNTLATYVVNDYLQMMGISTDLSVSDSWNPVVRMCADVADLEVTGLGRLECRPVRSHQQTCYIPSEVQSDRIGYVVVQIDDASFEATVLGFTPTVARDEFAITQLGPIEDLFDHIEHLTQPVQAIVTATPASDVVRSTRVNLSQWLTNVFESGWQTIETVLNPAQPDLAFGFRSADSALLANIERPDAGIRRAKLIDLGMQLAGHPVALIVELQPESERRSHITLQVHPAGNQVYLPPLLQLIVLDESGLVFLEAIARSADNYIQLQFSGLPREQFSVKIALGEASLMEDFIV